MAIAQYGRAILAIILVLGLPGITLPGCSSTPPKPDPRYQFPDLETADRIRSSNVTGWQAIDGRSLVISTSPKKHYLLILDRRLPDLKFAYSIGLSSTGNSIQTKFDCVKIVAPRPCVAGADEARIRTIYILPSKDDIPRIKAAIKAR